MLHAGSPGADNSRTGGQWEHRQGQERSCSFWSKNSAVVVTSHLVLQLGALLLAAHSDARGDVLDANACLQLIHILPAWHTPAHMSYTI